MLISLIAIRLNLRNASIDTKIIIETKKQKIILSSFHNRRWHHYGTMIDCVKSSRKEDFLLWFIFWLTMRSLPDMDKNSVSLIMGIVGMLVPLVGEGPIADVS